VRRPQRGDIWQVDLNPTFGHEQQGKGKRPVMVISEDAFNRLGLILVCPVTQGGSQSRFVGFAVNLLGSGTATQGVVLSNQPRTLDLSARRGSFVEHAPGFVVAEVLARLQAIVE